MFFTSPGKPTKLKKTVYLSAVVILGVLLSFITHAFIEIKYLRLAFDRGLTVNFYNGCALPPALNFGLLLLGAAGGFLVGRLWWRLVYVDRAWAKK